MVTLDTAGGNGGLVSQRTAGAAAASTSHWCAVSRTAGNGQTGTAGMGAGSRSARVPGRIKAVCSAGSLDALRAAGGLSAVQIVAERAGQFPSPQKRELVKALLTLNPEPQTLSPKH